MQPVISHRCRTNARQALARDREAGQTTAEYALVLLAAATIAMLVVGWAQGSNAIGALLDAVMDQITSLIE